MLIPFSKFAGRFLIFFQNNILYLDLGCAQGRDIATKFLLITTIIILDELEVGKIILAHKEHIVTDRVTYVNYFECKYTNFHLAIK